jgi:hypothetical protein
VFPKQGTTPSETKTKSSDKMKTQKAIWTPNGMEVEIIETRGEGSCAMVRVRGHLKDVSESAWMFAKNFRLI